MPGCRYCGEPAGTLRFSHDDCAQRHKTAAKKIPEFFVRALGTQVDPDRFRQLATNIAETSFIEPKKFRKLVVLGLTEMIETALDDGTLSAEEGRRIIQLCSAFEIEGNDPDFKEIARKFKKAEILRELSAGRVPDGIAVTGQLPISLSRNEKVVWVFEDVRCYKIRTTREYTGGSQGVSFRVMKGVSFRVGNYRGRVIKSSELAEEGRGALVITSKNLFFQAPMKSFKIAASKIVSVEPYSDAIAILRDGANATPVTFKVDDPWFAATAIARLNQVT